MPHIAPYQRREIQQLTAEEQLARKRELEANKKRRQRAAKRAAKNEKEHEQLIDQVLQEDLIAETAAPSTEIPPPPEPTNHSVENETAGDVPIVQQLTADGTSTIQHIQAPPLSEQNVGTLATRNHEPPYRSRQEADSESSSLADSDSSSISSGEALQDTPSATCPHPHLQQQADAQLADENIDAIIEAETTAQVDQLIRAFQDTGGCDHLHSTIAEQPQSAHSPSPTACTAPHHEPQNPSTQGSVADNHPLPASTSTDADAQGLDHFNTLAEPFRGSLEVDLDDHPTSTCVTPLDIERGLSGTTHDSSSNQPSMPPDIALERDHLKGPDWSNTSTMKWDIDSLILFTQDLGALRSFNFQGSPISVQNLQTNIHMNERVSEHDEAGLPIRGTSKRVEPKDIPHVCIGSIETLPYSQVHILFPRMYKAEEKFSKVAMRQSTLQRFWDMILIPAFNSVLPKSVLQQLAGSWKDYQHGSTARSYETNLRTRLNLSASTARVQLINHHIRGVGDRLSNIWRKVTELLQGRAGDPDYALLQNPLVMVSTKNIKLRFEWSSLEEVVRGTPAFLQQSFDMEKIDLERLFLDIGREIVPSPVPDSLKPAVTHMWRRCCLQHRRKALLPDRRGRDGQERCQTAAVKMYQNLRLRDATNMTITYPKNSASFKVGLVYSQFYNSMKAMMDSAKTYPFCQQNLELLTIDRGISKIWFARCRLNPDLRAAALRSYNASKRRVAEALQARQFFNYGTREEHRISYKLLKAMQQRFDGTATSSQHDERAGRASMDAGSSSDSRISNYAPVWTLETSTLNLAVINMLEIVIGAFEHIYRIGSRSSYLSDGASCISRILLRCLSHIVLAVEPARTRHIFIDQRVIPQPPSLQQRGSVPQPPLTLFGLGTAETTRKHGFAWLMPRIDWQRLEIHDEFRAHLRVPAIQAVSLHYSYIKQLHRLLRTRESGRSALHLLTVHRRSRECMKSVMHQIESHLMRIFRRDLIAYIERRQKTDISTELGLARESETAADAQTPNAAARDLELVEGLIKGDIPFDRRLLCQLRGLFTPWITSMTRSSFRGPGCVYEVLDHFWPLPDQPGRSEAVTQQEYYLLYTQVCQHLATLYTYPVMVLWTLRFRFLFLATNPALPFPGYRSDKELMAKKQGSMQMQWLVSDNKQPLRFSQLLNQGLTASCPEQADEELGIRWADEVTSPRFCISHKYDFALACKLVLTVPADRVAPYTQPSDLSRATIEGLTEHLADCPCQQADQERSETECEGDPVERQLSGQQCLRLQRLHPFHLIMKDGTQETLSIARAKGTLALYEMYRAKADRVAQKLHAANEAAQKAREELSRKRKLEVERLREEEERQYRSDLREAKVQRHLQEAAAEQRFEEMAQKRIKADAKRARFISDLEYQPIKDLSLELINMRCAEWRLLHSEATVATMRAKWEGDLLKRLIFEERFNIGPRWDLLRRDKTLRAKYQELLERDAERAASARAAMRREKEREAQLKLQSHNSVLRLVSLRQEREEMIAAEVESIERARYRIT